MNVRRPTQAGAFYEGDAETLKTQIKNCFLHELGPKKLPPVNTNRLTTVVGLVCPHAGYMYSGPVAANAYYALAEDGKPDTAVILGPNHRNKSSTNGNKISKIWLVIASKPDLIAAIRLGAGGSVSCLSLFIF